MKYLLIIVLILIGYICFSQNIAIDIDNTQHLIPGFNNTIHIIAENTACEELLVETDNGYIEQFSNCKFKINPSNTGICTLSIFKKSTKKLIAVKKIKVMKWPILVVDFDLNKTGKIYKNELYNVAKHQIKLTEYSHYSDLHVLSFKYKVIRNGLTMENRKILGNKFDEAFQKNIHLLRHNDFVIIYDAEILFQGEVATRILSPYSFVVQEYDDENISDAYFNINCISSGFLDTTSQYLTKYFDNEKPMIELKKEDGKWRRKLYFENGSIYQDAEVKLMLVSDTLELFDAVTYDQRVKIHSRYSEEFNGLITQYYSKNNLKHIELQGRMSSNLKEGLWLYCTHPDENNKQTCYEAYFENDVLVGEIKKIKSSTK
jgi:hypothetical protein